MLSRVVRLLLAVAALLVAVAAGGPGPPAGAGGAQAPPPTDPTRTPTSTPPAPTGPSAPSPPPLASVVVDADTGELISASTARAPLSPASTTKILTALLVRDRLAFDDTIA